MEISRPHAIPLSPAQQQELLHLQTVVEKAIADGKLSKAEMEQIHQELWKDGTVTAEELGMIRDTIRSYTGNDIPAYEWAPPNPA